MNLSKMSLIFLTAVVNSCAYDIKKTTPSFLDVPKGYARVYHARAIKNPACGKPDYEFYDSGERKPISEMNGWICGPVEQFQDAINHYNAWRAKQDSCGEQVEMPSQ